MVPVVLVLSVIYGVYSFCSSHPLFVHRDTPEEILEQFDRLAENDAEENDPVYFAEKEKIDSLIISLKSSYRPKRIFFHSSFLYVVMDVPTDYGYDQVAEGYAMEIKEAGIKSIQGVVIKNVNTGNSAGISPVIPQ